MRSFTCTHFENDLGVAGGISVTTSDRARVTRSESLGLSLVVLAAILAAGAGVAAGLAASAFGYVMSRPFDRAARILSGEVVNPSSEAALPQLAAEAHRSWIEAEARVDRGLSHLGALDDAA